MVTPVARREAVAHLKASLGCASAIGAGTTTAGMSGSNGMGICLGR